MIGARVRGATRVLGKSQGYIGLAVRDETVNTTVDGPETPVMVTAWEPTPVEIAAIVAGAPVHVRIVGTAHPPILVGVGEPPNPQGPGMTIGTITGTKPGFTPGPWVAGFGLQGGFSIEVGGGFGAHDYAILCQRSPWPHRAAESEANAHLIAAAPDLYAALSALVTTLAAQDDEGLIEHAEPMAAARRALAKANPIPGTV